MPVKTSPTTKTKPFQISRTHPNFFGTLVIFTVATILLGITMVTDTGYGYSANSWNIAKTIAPMSFFGTFAIVSASVKIIGMYLNKPLLIRVGISLSTFFYLFIAICLAMNFFINQNSSPSGPIIWSSVGLLHFLFSFEPFVNPANRRD